MNILLKFLTVLLIIGVGVAGIGYLAVAKPVVTPDAPKERIWTVSVAEARFAEVRPELKLYGLVIAGREVEVSALVAGQVHSVGENFADGGIVRAGDPLVEVDPFDYRATLAEQRARLDEARAKLDEFEARRRAESATLARAEEQRRLSVRDRERLSRLKDKGNASQRALDDAVMTESRLAQAVESTRIMLDAEAAKVAQQRAVIERLEVAVRRAERDLARTRIAAPFDGYLLETRAHLGKRLATGETIARMVDVSRLEVSFHMPDSQYGRILGAEGDLAGRPARVHWRTGGQVQSYDALIDRVAARIDATSGGVDIYARIIGAVLGGPLRPGAFVEVRVDDRVYAHVARLPETALHGDDRIYVLKEGRIEARRVELGARIGDQVLIAAGIEDGDQVIVTRFNEIADGLRAEVR